MRVISDALVVAVELRAECGVLWSEDMKSGGGVDRRRIVNAFHTRGCLLGMAVPLSRG